MEATTVLIAAGMPDGAIRPPPAAADHGAIRRAVAEMAACGVEPRLREPLYAWLAAFHHHFPSAFTRTLGPCGEALMVELATSDHDRDRFLKLRRIAVANLAQLF